MVDERAQRLAYEAFLLEYGVGKTVERCFDVALAAYEAAKWRPIDEMADPPRTAQSPQDARQPPMEDKSGAS